MTCQGVWRTAVLALWLRERAQDPPRMKMAGDSNQALAINGGAQGAAGRVHDYRAYGPNIRSELLLPELDPAAFKAPDVSIRVRPHRRLDREPAGHRLPLRARPPIPGLAAGRLLRDPRRLGHRRRAGLDRQRPDGPHAAAGPGHGLLLHLRGMLVLHASAIGVGDQAVVFMGDKGAGKSTTAAAMIAAGHPL